LFSAITMNWRGRPLTSHEVVVQSIAATTTRTGLKVDAVLDDNSYPTGVTISDTHMDAVAVTGHTFHPDWNYTLHPQPAPASDPNGDATDPASSPDTFDRTVLTDPALTGISRTELAALATALATPQQAAREKASHERLGTHRQRAPGAGRRPTLSLTDQITAALLHRRLALPPALLARLLTISTDTARRAIRDTQRLLDDHGFTTPPPAAHLTTLAALSHYAAAQGIHRGCTTNGVSGPIRRI
jgi:hypothetical protein